jgi:putative transcriptional regulator
MIKYKFNIADALQRAGFTTYTAQKTKLLGADIMRKLKNEDTNISIKTLNTICNILDMQPKDIIYYEEEEVDKEQKNKLE